MRIWTGWASKGQSGHFLPSAVAGLLLLLASSVQAASLRVHFDVPPTVACRDVTTAEFRQMHPDESLIEARFKISSLIAGDERRLLQYFYRFASPKRRLRIVDYLPRTKVASDLAGNVAIEKRREKTRNLGVAVTGSWEALGKVTGNGGLGTRDASSVRYERLPPKELVAASGTLQRGAGAFFKLKPSRQSTLEGGKEFVLKLRAPADWRGDLIYLRCEATATSRNPLTFDESQTHGQSFVIGLYRQGDAEAKRLVFELAGAERELRAVAVRDRRKIQRKAFPTAAHRLGAMLSLVDSRIPTDWLQRLLANPLGATSASLIRLPDGVREAANAYLLAAGKVSALGGRR